MNKPVIFILDDDRYYSVLLRRELERKYASVFAYNKAEDMIDDFAMRPNIIILDHYLESELGTDVLSRIKSDAFFKKAYVIYLSSQEHVNVVFQAIESGAAEYVEKNSNTVDELKRIIDQIAIHTDNFENHIESSDMFKKLMSK